MSVLINNKAGLINEIKDLCKTNKSKTIPLVCNTLCGFSVDCQIAITPGAICLDIGSKTIHWKELENEEDHFPSTILFSKFYRPGFDEYINDSPLITDAEIETAVNKLIQILDNISFTPLRIYNAQSVSPRSLITAHFVGVLNVQRCNKKINRFTPKPIKECSVCYEDTCVTTDCKHPLCLPCLEQMQMKSDRHFMTNDCPLCRQEITGY
jgi:hypothetical protein